MTDNLDTNFKKYKHRKSNDIVEAIRQRTKNYASFFIRNNESSDEIIKSFGSLAFKKQDICFSVNAEEFEKEFELMANHKRFRGHNEARLKSKVLIDNNGCWIWQNSVTEAGYGTTILKGRLQGAHRASWKVFIGEIPEGMQVNHKCHVRKCINPEHLYLGSQKENIADAIKANRRNTARGKNISNAKLDEAKVEVIKKLLAEGVACNAIAKIYEVSPSTIEAVHNGITWKHVNLKEENGKA